MTAAVLTLLLAGCAGSFEIPARPTVIEAPVAPVEPVCLVRARLFRGLVGVPCASLAQEFRP